MANVNRQITLTQKGNNSGPFYDVYYSLDCITYTICTDGLNVFLPNVGSTGIVTLPDNTQCIKLVNKSPLCNNEVIQDLRATTTTTSTTTTSTTTTTTAAPTTTTTTTTTTSTTTTTTAAPTTTTTTAGASATLYWSFSELGGGNGIYDLYINSVSVETRNNTANGTYTVYVGDVISVGCNADQCTSGGSTYTNIVVTGEITDAACQNNGSIPSYVSPGYTVVSGDAGTNLYLDLQVSCDGGCI